MGAYHRGQSVKLSCAFTDAAGAPANPASVACLVRAPDGTESTPTVTNPSLGTFEAVVAATQSGRWTYRWEGTTGTTTPRDEDVFHVLLSAF